MEVAKADACVRISQGKLGNCVLGRRKAMLGLAVCSKSRFGAQRSAKTVSDWCGRHCRWQCRGDDSGRRRRWPDDAALAPAPSLPLPPPPGAAAHYNSPQCSSTHSIIILTILSKSRNDACTFPLSYWRSRKTWISHSCRCDFSNTFQGLVGPWLYLLPTPALSRCSWLFNLATCLA